MGGCVPPRYILKTWRETQNGFSDLATNRTKDTRESEGNTRKRGIRLRQHQDKLQNRWLPLSMVTSSWSLVLSFTPLFQETHGSSIMGPFITSSVIPICLPLLNMCQNAMRHFLTETRLLSTELALWGYPLLSFLHKSAPCSWFSFNLLSFSALTARNECSIYHFSSWCLIPDLAQVLVIGRGGQWNKFIFLSSNIDVIIQFSLPLFCSSVVHGTTDLFAEPSPVKPQNFT